MVAKAELARRVYATLSTAATDADAQPDKLARLIAHAQAVGAAKVLMVLDVAGAASAMASHHQSTVSTREAIEIDLAAQELALAEKPKHAEWCSGICDCGASNTGQATAEKPLRSPASTFLAGSYSSSFTAAETTRKAPEMPPVADHEAEGDGSADPTWCWCGRSFSEHLRRPR